MTNVITILVMISFALVSCQESVQKPNIILIMTDDQGWNDVGFNGNTEIKTPYLDALASEGIIFNRFYSASAVCSPTRASVLTGRNPLRMNIPYANSGHLKEQEITVPEILKAEGYATGHFGKWHLGTLSKTILDANRGGREKFIDDYSVPSQHGFDVSFCTESKVPTFDPMVYPSSFHEGASMRYGWKAVSKHDSIKSYGTAYWNETDQKETANLNGDNSRIIMDRVLPFIEQSHQSNQPFFTSIWLHTPHLPVVSDSIHRGYYSDLDLAKQLYYGTITAMDEQIGRLWNKLAEAGIQNETLIFFCSDNGPENGTPGSAGDFRARKRSLYEGGVRVPAFVVWKNHFEGGKRIQFPTVTSDYLPTILDILNVDYPDDRPIDGLSILDVLEGRKKDRAKPIGFICAPQISWMTHQYKLIADENLEHYELYDLLNDQSERENIIETFPDVADRLKSDLKEWLNSVNNSKQELDYD